MEVIQSIVEIILFAGFYQAIFVSLSSSVFYFPFLCKAVQSLFVSASTISISFEHFPSVVFTFSPAAMAVL